MSHTQVSAELSPLSSSKVAVQFKTFKIFGLIPVTAPPSAYGAQYSCSIVMLLLLLLLLAALSLPLRPPTLCVAGSETSLLSCCMQTLCHCCHCAGELDITYLDDSMRVSRGDKGNLFVLLMDDRDDRP